MTNTRFTKEEAKYVKAYLLDGDDELDYNSEASYKLYEILMPEMPYSVAKARDATPEEWYPEYFARYTDDEIRQWVDDHTV